MASPEYSLAEVGNHNKEGDLWVVIDGKVYDCSKFGKVHPGGIPPLLDPTVAGKDCTDLFYGLHRSSVLLEPRYTKLQIGVVAKADLAAMDAAKTKKGGRKVQAEADFVLPYSESSGSWRKHSPYYKESHHKFRAAVRAILDKEVKPFAKGWDDAGEHPSRELDKRLGDAGIFACLVAGEEGVGELFREHGIKLPGGLQPEEYDYFHGLVLAEELRRGMDGCYGVGDGLYGGVSIGLPPLLKFGSRDLILKCALPCIKGEKRICLAISEPYAGSDVQQIRAFAAPQADGGWVVTGVKKWITGGMVADYFTTLCRTEKQGPVMLLMERDDAKGTLTTKAIKTSYSAAACTAYVVMHNAYVPSSMLIGQVGMGFMQTMANFNFERWGMIIAGNRHARMVFEECFRWSLTRRVFGKTLVQQPVIRLKLAEMAAEIETVHSMLEDLTYQMNNMTTKEINKELAGTIALLKYRQTRCATVVSDNACQIFGGRALTNSGMGRIVEGYQRTFKFQAILGGSEEIMADFAIRQAMRKVEDMPARL